jgi:glyoxylase-like metal-dependent hydrolase (beta-lactamase superfamily II)
MTALVHRFKPGIGWAYLVEGRDGVVLVDAGSVRRERQILAALGRLAPKPLRLIYVTHAHLDHYGSAAAVRRATGAPIAVHPADAGAMTAGETPLGHTRSWGRVVKAVMPVVNRFIRPEPVEPDILLEDGMRLDEYGIDAISLHTPGHTPGSSTLLVEGRIAFAGDLVSSRWWPHAQLFYANDWDQLRRSIERLQAFKPELVYTGHAWAPMPGEAFAGIKMGKR